jgi:hypothetical protein
LPAAILLVLGAAAWTAAARADDVPESSAVVQRCSFTDAEASHIKWLPYRSGRVHDDSQVLPADHQAPLANSDQAPSATGNTLDDPFGDHGRKSAQTPRPVEPAVLGDDAQGSRAMPQFPALGPGAATPGEVISRPVPTITAAQRSQGRRPLDLMPQMAQPERVGPNPRGSRPEPMGEPEMAAVGDDLQGKCTTARELVQQRPITGISSNIRAKAGDFPHECPLGAEPFEPRCWSPTTYTWTAAATCHKPLYFEEVALERYGHTWGPILQPLISAGHFFITVPLLPYKMGLEPPCECIYTLGYYRPGSCAPYILDPLPLSIRAAMFEAAGVAGFMFVMPGT